MSVEHMTDEFKAKIHSDGLLQVFKRSEPALQETKYHDGQTSTKIIDKDNADKSERKMLNALARMPVFAATYAGGGEWWCDIDAGFQRWTGVKSGAALSKAMRNCGFERGLVSKIMRQCRKHKWNFCPRQW